MFSDFQQSVDVYCMINISNANDRSGMVSMTLAMCFNQGEAEIVRIKNGRTDCWRITKKAVSFFARYEILSWQIEVSRGVE